MFGHLVRCYTIYTFWGLLSPNGILPGATFTLRPSLAFPILAALLHDNQAVCVNQTLRRETRKGNRELSLLVCATYIPQGGHNVGHRPTFY